jgi:hypothetical protein
MPGGPQLGSRVVGVVRRGRGGRQLAGGRLAVGLIRVLTRLTIGLVGLARILARLAIRLIGLWAGLAVRLVRLAWCLEKAGAAAR